MKHGNRGVTSKCGSADLLAALGVNLEAPPEKLRRALGELGFVFFFAPAYHPAFKHIGPVRKALAQRGHRTIFNILGPLINPGRPGRVLLGVFAEAWVEKLAGAFDKLGVQRGLAVHGVIAPGTGIDELTTATPNRVRGLGEWREMRGQWRGEDFGLRRPGSRSSWAEIWRQTWRSSTVCWPDAARLASWTPSFSMRPSRCGSRAKPRACKRASCWRVTC
jgi:anthranilate phosphoribosyltransferase